MYEKILDKIIWSFSSVNSYTNCPRCFKFERIDKVSKVQNAFAEWGSFMHSLFERYFSGELEFFELAPLYEKDYKKNVKETFPYNRYVDLSEKYYNTGLEYLSEFEGMPENYEVLGVEEKANLVVDGRPFVGYIDLVLRDRNSNALVVWDHKSKADFKNDQEHMEYLRQLYLYAEYVKEKYGEYPAQLTFNMFRVGKIVESDFDQNELDATKRWFIGTIEKIYEDREFKDKIEISCFENFKDLDAYKPGSDFFCANLCGARMYCPRSGCKK